MTLFLITHFVKLLADVIAFRAKRFEINSHNLLNPLFCYFKVGLSVSKRISIVCLIESPLKMMKNAFYFILKVLFVLKIFKILSRLFGRVEKTA